ncbi:hypothetical protein N7539_009529 [Penicillium diatomitis]|uniref:MINDY deubiquitinase domain-containing protein n=1 Tax=Penicillium diatomitis TaxID=2819901 RepID=A0A9X0BJ10_9EURO|nr:uncharacterized protein N7539_009529 [Penicillium diatomitis]KAJ5466573.1 hypothetical protein N7539_009529 [Penicillium diatomitis]
MSPDETRGPPASTAGGSSQNPWAENVEDRTSYDYRPTATGAIETGDSASGHQPIPPALQAGHHSAVDESWDQPVNSAPPVPHYPDADSSKHLQSKNPFLKSRPHEQNQDWKESSPWDEQITQTSTSDDYLHRADGFIPMTARLSLADNSEQPGDPWANQQSAHVEPPRPVVVDPPQDASPWGPESSYQAPAAYDVRDQTSHVTQNSQSVYPQSLGADDGGWVQPPSEGGRTDLDIGLSAPSQQLIDLDFPGTRSGLGAGAHSGAHSFAASQEAYLSDSTDFRPDLPPRHISQGRGPPLPSRTLSPAEEARQKQQRAETYTIRQINWTNGKGQLIQSPILMQNENGPCPLLALINALVLQASTGSAPPIVRALKSREQISLGLLIEALFDQLTTSLGPDDEFPDIDALAQFLTMLHTGMNVNPRLTLETKTSLGTFQSTNDLQSYSTFGIPLIHGWLASWSSPEHAAMNRLAPYHEDIQLLPFRQQELEDRIMRGDLLNADEEGTMADIETIQKFVEIENVTQLSPFGLTQLSTQLAAGSVCILFRNDHFSTLYKHPESQQLYNLVTDAGYANHAEVVWESLVDVTGFNSQLLSGDFRVVSQESSSRADPESPDRPAIPPRPSVTEHSSAPSSAETLQQPSSHQEQSDADYAYALSLQFQEEERRERVEEEPARETTSTTQHTRAHRHSVPVRFNGPAVHMDDPPARTSSSGVGLRPPQGRSNADDPHAPPPPYERTPSNASFTPPASTGPTPDHVRVNPSMPGLQDPRHRYSHSAGPADRYSNDRPRNKDCIVM